jgi:cyanophycinase-like exopeptidase
VPRAVIVPHFNEIPRVVVRPWLTLRPSGTRAIGVDAGTAMVGRRGEWRVLGEGFVTIVEGEGERVLAPGERFV